MNDMTIIRSVRIVNSKGGPTDQNAEVGAAPFTIGEARLMIQDLLDQQRC